jgi:hypothetical protein
MFNAARHAGEGARQAARRELVLQDNGPGLRAILRLQPA